jgi:hypothetical protein
LIRRAVRLDSQKLIYQTPALTCKKRIRIISFPILVHRTTARHRCSARLAINSPCKLGSPAPPRECCCDRPSLGWRATSAEHRGPTAWRGQVRRRASTPTPIRYNGKIVFGVSAKPF